MPLCSGGLWQPSMKSIRKARSKIDLNDRKWLNN